MENIKLIYIRDSTDPFLKGFCDNLGDNFEIYILDLKKGVFINLSKKKVLKLFILYNSNNRLLNYVQRYFFAIVFLVRAYKMNFDLCHILNIKRENFWLIPFLKKKTKKIIVSVYGRSTYNNYFKRTVFSAVYRHINAFTFTNTSTLLEFKKNHPKIKKEILYSIMLPLVNISSLDKDIDKIKRDKFIEKHSINLDKLRISCSSTASSYDQHFKIIKALKGLHNREKVQLLFLLTYGGTNENKLRIIDFIHEQLVGFDYVIFDSFLEQQELEIYRELTDIYINMRKTDQIAGAVLESLSKGSLLVSAEWLDYSMLINLGVKIHTVNSFIELSSVIDSLVSDFSNIKSKVAFSNSCIVKREFGLDYIIEKWRQFYISL